MPVPVIPILGAILPTITSVLDRLIPDPVERERIQREAQSALLAQEAALQQAVIGVIQSEAQSEHWLAASWRPIVMLTFTALIVARWCGFAAPGISEQEVVHLWNIVEVGLGGYVIGRTVEKVAPTVAASIAATRK